VNNRGWLRALWGANARTTGGTVNGIRTRTEHGASAVEFALVLPFVVLLIFGVVTTGLAYSDHLSITNAVREGARYGAAADYSASASDWADSVRSRVEQVYFNSGDSIDDDQICVKLVMQGASGATLVPNTDHGNDPACGTAPSAPDDMATDSCAVMVWVSKPQRIQLIIAPDLTFHISAQSVAYYGRSVDSGCQAG
jgi:Flp pilus assembly protein TadG